MVNKKPKIGFSISAKLLFGALIAAASLILVSLEGNSILGDAEQHMSTMIDKQVRPLVLVNKLQSQLDSIRIAEDELPRTVDFFALTGALQRLKQQSHKFNQDVLKLTRELEQDNSNLTHSIIHDWKQYSKDIQAVIAAANTMDFKEVDRITQHSSGPHFESISQRLSQLSISMEQQALDYSLTTQRVISRKRVTFWIMTSIAVFLILFITTMIAQSTSIRIRKLRNAAIRICDDAATAELRVEGSDELTDLAQAFNLMQLRIMSREYELKRQQELLEVRVNQRTEELSNINMQLHQEVEDKLRTKRTIRLLSKALACL